MCCAGIQEICRRKLMNMPEPLKRAGIKHLALVCIQTYEYMNRISDFMAVFYHFLS